MVGRTFLLAFLSLVGLSTAWLPNNRAALFHRPGPDTKIRGVNLGSLFVYEPWIANNTWTSMCGDKKSEFDCVMHKIEDLHLSQEEVDKVFRNHWNHSITKGDLDEMKSYGLNTIRIPIGYWMDEDLIYEDSEYFPRGGLFFLKRLCGWASDRGFYIILDQHGAPGAQVANNSFTGQYANDPGFYQWWQFERAEKFLVWLTNLVHTTREMRNVGMIEVVNEPLQEENYQTWYMRSDFYPKAYEMIRNEEKALNIADEDMLHIQFMNSYWGSGDPNEYLDELRFCAYDDHRYLKWTEGIDKDKEAYLGTSCHDNRLAEWPTIVGEWSLSVPSDFDGIERQFFINWFAAQVKSYEQYTDGWIFWTWKTELGWDYTWGYKDAVEAGIIPTPLPDDLGVELCTHY